MTTNRTSTWAIPVVVATTTLATACAGAVPNDQVAQSIAKQLQDKAINATEVTCPRDLTAVVGESVTCSFRVEGQSVNAVATVQSVGVDRAEFVVETRARPVEEGSLEQSLAADLAGKTHWAMPDIDCPDDLAPVVGTSILCDIGDSGRSARVSVSKVSDGAVTYDVVVS